MIRPIILAAGKGTRMRSALPKTLHTVAGKPIINRIIDAFSKVEACAQPLVVVGHGAEQVAAAAAPCKTVLMQELSGTASAVTLALTKVTEPAVLVVNGDHPFISAASIRRIAQIHATEPAALIWGTTTVPDFDGWRQTFSHYGRVVRANGGIERMVEYKNASEAERNIKEVNTNVVCADAAWLRLVLPRVSKNPLTGEYYITDLVALANTDGKNIRVVELSPIEAYGINTPEELGAAQLLAKELS